MTRRDPKKRCGGGRRVGMAMLVVGGLVCGAECEVASLTGGDVATRLLPARQVATPVFQPEDRSFSKSIDVEIVCASEDATIQYSLDGQPPYGSRGTLYTGPIRLDRTTPIRAVAYIAGALPSDMAEATFTKTDRLLDCVGDYEGTFDGGSVGKLSFTLLESGALLGLWTSPVDGSRRVAGTVHPDGSVEAAEPKQGLMAEGVFDFEACTSEGTWQTAAGEKGRWKLQRISPE